MKILFTSKGNKEGINTEEMIKFFENSNNLEDLKTKVKNAEDRLSVTWASVEISDHAGELIPIEDIINEQDTLLKRNGPITDEHTNRIIGETLAYKVMRHPKTDSFGVLHLDKTFDDNELDDKVWGEIQSGERTGASVGGFNTGQRKGTDKVTGEETIILEGFKQLETASVFDPCNPMALTEAFSVVAKSNKSEVKKLVEGGHRHTGSDPEGLHTHPELEKTKKIYEEEEDKKKTYINKPSFKKGINKGDTMKTDAKKSISKIEKVLEGIQKELTKLKKEDENLEEEKQEEDDLEDKKKAEHEEEEPEDKKKAEHEEDLEDKKKQEDEAEDEDEDEVNKEEAKGDIEGEEPAADQPEPPEPKDVNDKDVFKQLNDVKKQLNKLQGDFMNKSTTPRPSGLKKVEKSSELAMQIATGKKKFKWSDVHKMVNKIESGEVV